jgi:hypothetical protein
MPALEFCWSERVHDIPCCRYQPHDLAVAEAEECDE